MNTPEPVKPEAEPNWQELESALWAARSQTNEIANRGIDRVVSFFKKLHERTEPKVCHCSCKDGQRACDAYEETHPSAPDLTEDELNALANYGIGSDSPYYKRLISELRRRRKEAKELESIIRTAFESYESYAVIPLSLRRWINRVIRKLPEEVGEKDSKVHLSYCTCWCGAKH